jgi:phage-related baseplate assembly protein
VSLPEPNFIDRDPQAITAELVAQYEALTGKTLYPAQVERLLIDVIAYRETLVRVGIQEAAKQCLVAYARAPMLDYLGELVGVTRLPAQPAKTTERFSIAAALATNVLIPAGTRVESGDGRAVFATDADATLVAGQTSIDIAVTAVEPGTDGNGWQPGQINVLVDEFVEADFTVTNLTASSGGIAEEDDERLRESIRLAPEAFSTAGSRLAYRFHAMRAHQSIVDVAVLSPAPVVVKLYPLTQTGLPDASLLTQVEATCSAEKVRPLTDQVQALAPTQVDYAITAQLTPYTSADAASVLAKANEAAAAYKADRAAGLGRDIVPSQIIAALQVAGCYQVALTSPAALIAVGENEWAHCTAINLTLAGAVNG